MTEPLPPDAGIVALVGWVSRYRDRFTDEALRTRLLETGHRPEDVDEAFRIAGARRLAASGPPSGPLPPVTTPDDYGSDPGVGLVLGLILILGVPWLLSGLAAPFAGYALLLSLAGTFVAWLILRRGEGRGYATGLGWALVIVVTLPMIAIVGIFGLCLVAGPRGGL